MQVQEKIFVAGHRGLVGSAIVRQLQAQGWKNLIFRSSRELDLREKDQVNLFFETSRPAYVFLAAAKVGGIWANKTKKAEFLRDNLLIQINVMEAAYRYGVKKLLFLGSSCIYPRLAPQPMKEEYLLTGTLEETNDAYAIAKIAGIMGCKAYREQYGCNFISCMPTNLYGPGDNFDLESSHVLPAMIHKFHKAKEAGLKEVELWGTGTPKREFLFVDDMASACIYLMQHYNGQEHINIGVGKDISISDLALMVSKCVGYTQKIIWNTDKPDGTPRKLMDITRLRELGFEPRTSLETGINLTYQWFLQQEISR
ncbi:MAG: GDP-L-fucose synthase [Candidatus Cloacimonetes bacterium]|nr:GDP-L-fucose synthase [Candidatus Cloacimonadota bacterium]